MRLFTKYFLFGMLVLGLAFSVSGYFLLHYFMESSLAREAEFALMQYQYDKFTVQSAMLSYSDIFVVIDVGEELFPEEERIYSMWKNDPESSPELQIQGNLSVTESGLAKGLFADLAEELSSPAAFFQEDGTLIYSEIQGLDPSFLEGLSEEAHVYRFQDTAEGGCVLVGSVLNCDNLKTAESVWNVGEEYQGTFKILPKDEDGADSRIIFVTQWDIGKTVRQQQILRQYFIRCYLVAMTAGMALLGVLSALLTRPLKRMSKAAGRMAEGYYEERLAISGRDEIGELAGSFNRMAEAVEEKIGELSRAAREKEDFVANFAHELKTPLTSIIGYADTIYQKNLSREDVRRASWNIWNEGMRLEALSFKLMELTVLGRQEFPLVEMPADELLRDVAEGLTPLMEEKGVDLRLEAQPAYVKVDYDLLKTLLINLVDNSVKAGARRIVLSGQRREEESSPAPEGRYLIRVRDDGCGMEEEALSRITEAFYMVDKARSRKQHGAGLGLALADRIARVHGSELMFESRKGQGTEVRFLLEMGEAVCPENDEENIPGTGDGIGPGAGRDTISEPGKRVVPGIGKEIAFRTGEENMEGGADDRDKED